MSVIVCYFHQNKEQNGSITILSIFHIVTIATMLNVNGGNNEHWLKTLRVNQPVTTDAQVLLRITF